MVVVVVSELGLDRPPGPMVPAAHPDPALRGFEPLARFVDPVADRFDDWLAARSLRPVMRFATWLLPGSR